MRSLAVAGISVVNIAMRFTFSMLSLYNASYNRTEAIEQVLFATKSFGRFIICEQNRAVAYEIEDFMPCKTEIRRQILHSDWYMFRLHSFRWPLRRREVAPMPTQSQSWARHQVPSVRRPCSEGLNCAWNHAFSFETIHLKASDKQR